MDFDKLLQLMINKNGSDLFITADVAPSMKINGNILPVGKTPLSAEQTMRLVKGVMTAGQKKSLKRQTSVNLLSPMPDRMPAFVSVLLCSAIWQG